MHTHNSTCMLTHLKRNHTPRNLERFWSRAQRSICLSKAPSEIVAKPPYSSPASRSQVVRESMGTENLGVRGHLKNSQPVQLPSQEKTKAQGVGMWEKCFPKYCQKEAAVLEPWPCILGKLPSRLAT